MHATRPGCAPQPLPSPTRARPGATHSRSQHAGALRRQVCLAMEHRCFGLYAGAPRVRVLHYCRAVAQPLSLDVRDAVRSRVPGDVALPQPGGCSRAAAPTVAHERVRRERPLARVQLSRYARRPAVCLARTPRNWRTPSKRRDARIATLPYILACFVRRRQFFPQARQPLALIQLA